MKTIWALVIVIILAGGGWYLYSKNSDTASVTPSTTTQTNTGGADYTPEQTGGNDVGMEDGTGVGVSTGVTVNTQGYDALMSWTDAGFNPQTLTISKGQTVRFMNNGTGSVCPASDIHPTHSLYPQKSASDCLGSSFDACHGLKSREFYDCKFDSTGTWGCHNHLRANQKCSIVVK